MNLSFESLDLSISPEGMEETRKTERERGRGGASGRGRVEQSAVTREGEEPGGGSLTGDREGRVIREGE